MKIPFLRAQYNYDTMAVSDETGLKCEDSTLTQQHQAADADINNIIARFVRTGELPSMTTRIPILEDVSDYGSYHDVYTAMKAAEGAFYDLPQKVRDRFGDNPEELLQFLGNEENRAEAIALGLVEKKAAEAIVENKEPVVPAPPSP